MHYKFPLLRHINDVLPHIEGRDEFIVAVRPGYIVINYAVAFPGTFTMTGPDDIGGAIRRECRGLIFNAETGALLSRSYHKFFNLNEKEETQAHVVDLSRAHVLMEKMDGSMIRPLMFKSPGPVMEFALATKMGITDVAKDAEAWMMAQPDGLVKRNWMAHQAFQNKTPIFEWVSPKNQIVLVYDKADLVLTAVRDNLTGEYSLPLDSPFNTVPVYGRVEGNIEEYITRARARQGREGDIIRFDDGHMLKSKNDWYVHIHKTIERVAFDRHIVKLILDEELDDAIGLLPAERADYVREFERVFWAAFERTEHVLETLVGIARDKYEGDRKRVALEFIPQLTDKSSAGFIYNALNGKPMRELLLAHVAKNTGANVKWDECALWLGMDVMKQVIAEE